MMPQSLSKAFALSTLAFSDTIFASDGVISDPNLQNTECDSWGSKSLIEDTQMVAEVLDPKPIVQEIDAKPGYMPPPNYEEATALRAAATWKRVIRRKNDVVTQTFSGGELKDETTENRKTYSERLKREGKTEVIWQGGRNRTLGVDKYKQKVRWYDIVLPSIAGASLVGGIVCANIFGQNGGPETVYHQNWAYSSSGASLAVGLFIAFMIFWGTNSNSCHKHDVNGKVMSPFLYWKSNTMMALGAGLFFGGLTRCFCDFGSKLSSWNGFKGGDGAVNGYLMLSGIAIAFILGVTYFIRWECLKMDKNKLRF